MSGHFPKILEYLEEKQPAVFKLFDKSGMQKTLNPVRGGNITLLMPDEKTTEKIYKLIKANESEEYGEMISALILPELFLTTQDFAGKCITTALSKKLPVTKLDKNKVYLQGGAELTLNRDFATYKRKFKLRRDNISIWNMTGDLYDYNAAEEAELPRRKKTAELKQEQQAPKPQKLSSQEKRQRLIRSVEKNYIAWVRSSDADPNKETKNPYMLVSTAILTAMNKLFPDIFVRTFPLVCAPPHIMFYSLVQSPFVEPEFLNKCIVKITGMDINTLTEEWCKKASDCTLAKDNANTIGEALAILSRPIEYKKQAEVITAIIKNNKIGAKRSAFPESTIKLLERKSCADLFTLINTAGNKIMQIFEDFEESDDATDFINKLSRFFPRDTCKYLGTPEEDKLYDQCIRAHEQWLKIDREMSQNAKVAAVEARKNVSMSLFITLPMNLPELKDDGVSNDLEDAANVLATKYAFLSKLPTSTGLKVSDKFIKKVKKHRAITDFLAPSYNDTEESQMPTLTADTKLKKNVSFENSADNIEIDDDDSNIISMEKPAKTIDTEPVKKSEKQQPEKQQERESKDLIGDDRSTKKKPSLKKSSAQ